MVNKVKCQGIIMNSNTHPNHGNLNLLWRFLALCSFVLLLIGCENPFQSDDQFPDDDVLYAEFSHPVFSPNDSLIAFYWLKADDRSSRRPNK